MQMLVILQAILANVFVLKQISLFGLEVTSCDVYAVGAVLSLNLLQEVHGAEASKQAIWLSGAALLFFVCMSQFHLWYLPGVHDQVNSSLTSVFNSLPKIVFSSLGVFCAIQWIDFYLYAYVKRCLGEKHLFLRLSGTMLLVQALDTIGFAWFALAGEVASIWQIIIMSYLIKVIIILFAAPISAFIVSIVKKRQGQAFVSI